MLVKKLKIKYGQLTVERGGMSWWAWGMLLLAAITLAFGGLIWGRNIIN